MRTTEQRTAEILKRVNTKKEKAQKKKAQFFRISSIAACFVIIFAMGFLMPELIESVNPGSVIPASGMASIIGNNAALGYIIMGVLGFLLGICVTISLVLLRERQKTLKEKSDRDEF